MEISTMINDIIHVLQSLVFELGTLSISFYDIVRFLLLGILVVVLARMVNNYGKGIIKRQKRIDPLVQPAVMRAPRSTKGVQPVQNWPRVTGNGAARDAPS